MKVNSTKFLRATEAAPGRLLMLTAIVVALSSVLAIAQDPNYIKKIAEFARSKGETSSTVEVYGESGGTAFDLSVAMKRGSVFLVTATGRSRSLNLGSTIATWHWLRVEDALASRPPLQFSCVDELSNAPAVGPNEIGILVIGGTAVVDGVSVTLVDASWRRFAPMKGDRFVVLASRCPLGTITLDYGRNSLIAVSPDGALVPNETQAQTLGSVRTLVDVRKRLLVN